MRLPFLIKAENDSSGLTIVALFIYCILSILPLIAFEYSFPINIQTVGLVNLRACFKSAFFLM